MLLPPRTRIKSRDAIQRRKSAGQRGVIRNEYLNNNNNNNNNSHNNNNNNNNNNNIFLYRLGVSRSSRPNRPSASRLGRRRIFKPLEGSHPNLLKSLVRSHPNLLETLVERSAFFSALKPFPRLCRRRRRLLRFISGRSVEKTEPASEITFIKTKTTRTTKHTPIRKLTNVSDITKLTKKSRKKTPNTAPLPVGAEAAIAVVVAGAHLVDYPRRSSLTPLFNFRSTAAANELISHRLPVFLPSAIIDPIFVADYANNNVQNDDVNNNVNNNVNDTANSVKNDAGTTCHLYYYDFANLKPRNYLSPTLTSSRRNGNFGCFFFK